LKFSRFLSGAKMDFSRPQELPEPYVEIDILPICLHVDIEGLIEKRAIAIDRMMKTCNKVLMFYGLCGDSSKRVFSRDDIEIIAPMDCNEIVDDCICSILGKEEYPGQLKNLGSMFRIPGFALHWEKMTELVAGPMDPVKGMKMVLDAAGYKRLIDHDLWDEKKIEIARRHSKDVELPMEWTTGSIEILESCFRKAMEYLF